MAAAPNIVVNVVTVEGVKLNIAEGDTLAVMVPQLLTAKQREWIRAAIKNEFANVKVLVLDGGITVAAIPQA